jgi:hypothetical protein
VGKRLEIKTDKTAVTNEIEMRKRLGQRKLANFTIASIRVPVMGDVPVLPILPKRPDIDLMRVNF